ncbi:hypothetical protein CRM22_009947 [Opisthorchis felineus]|uniref:Thioredoxin domain-containing protein 17 n=1 Tax=Opisthorchis felineus TaxID=147828 RepID=A0A4S2L9Y5_OPIFE|nr:hypothetical protein CRM22_009947 [Opisthorchis felineus]
MSHQLAISFLMMWISLDAPGCSADFRSAIRPATLQAEQTLVSSIPQLEGCAASALADSRRVFIYFFGTTDPHTGSSWCPDVRRAEPAVLTALRMTNESDLFIWCEVGDRDEWISPDNPFRKHHVFRLKEIPTLVSLTLHNGILDVKSRLIGNDCKQVRLVEKFFVQG